MIMNDNYVVKIHCGSGHVRGKALNYPYYICSLFKKRKTKKGYKIWINTGKNTNPRRSYKLCQKDGEELANKNNCNFNSSYGSLHNKKV